VTPRRRGLLLAVVIALAGLAVAAGTAVLLLRGDDDAAEAGSTPGSTSRQPLDGFGEVEVTIEPPGSDPAADYCLLLAETSEQRQRGLMAVTDPDLGGYDGMLFRFESETEVGFWMKDTPMPLTVAYIGADGRLVSSADMEPCVGDAADVGDCPGYPPEGPYLWALEVPQGELDDLGMVPGARFTDADRPCP
jgi:uncharacterized membrane protein (UPF0127 family)